MKARRRAIVFSVATVIVLGTACGFAGTGKSKPGRNEPDPMALLEKCKEKCEGLTAFTQMLAKKENIGGKVGPREVIFLKFRAFPLSLYLKWLEGPNKDQEIIYVDGKNQNRLLCHRPVGPIDMLVKMDPYGSEARKHSARPITQAGIRNATTALMRLTENASRRGDVKLRCLGTEQYRGRPVRVVLRLLPHRPEYEAYMTLIYVDESLTLPVKVVGYDWNFRLLWAYESWDVRPAELTDRDFDPANPEYHFPGVLPVSLPWPFKSK